MGLKRFMIELHQLLSTHHQMVHLCLGLFQYVYCNVCKHCHNISHDSKHVNCYHQIQHEE